MSHKLTPKQIKAIHLLAAGATTLDVGAKLKLRRETLSRWRQLPEFQMEFERVMQEVCADMQQRLTRLVAEAISTVSYGMGSNHCEPKRLQSALYVLKLLGIDRIFASKAPETLPNVTQTLP